MSEFFCRPDIVIALAILSFCLGFLLCHKLQNGMIQTMRDYISWLEQSNTVFEGQHLKVEI
jgi:hypothetical protein